MDSGVGTLADKNGDVSQTGLDLLTKSQQSNFYHRSKYIPIHLINPVTNEGLYQFIVGGYDSPDLVMLKSLRLSVKFKVVKENGTSMDNVEKVSIVNNPIHSLFENIVCKLNDTPISDHARLYPYKAFLHQFIAT